MSLQYLDALKQIGSSPSTKFVVPLEVSELLSGLGGMFKAFGNGNANGGPRGNGQFQPAPEPAARAAGRPARAPAAPGARAGLVAALRPPV